MYFQQKLQQIIICMYISGIYMFVSQTGYGSQILVCILFGVLFKALILANSPTSMHIICAGGVLVSFFSSVLVHLIFLMLGSTSAYTRNIVAAIYIIPHYHYNDIPFFWLCYKLPTFHL